MLINTSKIFKSIEKEEVLPLILLFSYSFLNGFALIFFETTANTLFLMQYDTQTLPYVYMLTAVVSVISGYTYSKIEERVSIIKLLKISMLFVIAVVLFFLVLIKFSDSKLSYFGIMVAKDLVWMFVAMEFGILTGMIFNIRQGKRLFGLLMSGEILAGAIGGFSVGGILNLISTIDLLYISMATLSLSYLLLNYILNKFVHRFEEDDEEVASQECSGSYATLLKNRYYFLFFGVSILAFFIFYFIDYIFYYSVEKHFSNEKDLASFFGVFYAALNIINLISSLFVSAPMLNRFGLAFGILAIPALAFIGTTSLIVTTLASLGIGFFILISLKLLNEVFDISILNPTFKVLYQSIPVKQRMKVLAFRETIIEPMAMGVAGLLLLGISMLEGIDVVYYVMIVMSILWFVLGKSLKVYYVKSLEKLLHQRDLFSNDLLLEDIDVQVFLNGINSSDKIEVIYCLDALIKLEYSDIDSILTKLLAHENSEVRLNVLEQIQKLHKDQLTEVLHDKIDSEDDPQVLDKLLKLYCEFARVDAIEKLTPYLYHENIVIKEAAIVALLQYGGIDGILIAGSLLNKLFESESRDDKLSALKILTKMNVPSFYKPLKELLNSEDKEIKTISIQVVGNLKIKKFLPHLLKYLESDTYRNSVLQALVKFEGTIFHDLTLHFKNIDTLKSKQALIKVFSLMKREESFNFLLENSNNPHLHDTIIGRLSQVAYATKDEALIEKLLLINIKSILFYLSISKHLNETSFSNSLQIIKEIIEKKADNIFQILGFLFPKPMMLQASLNYKSNSSDKRAYAVEIIDNMISKSLKKSVLPILEEISFEKKLIYYEALAFNKVHTEAESVKYILEDESIPLILKLSTLYEVGKNGKKEYIDQIKLLSNNKDVDLQETALWVTKKLKKV